MAEKYTQKKILYLANREEGLHVSPSEFTRQTDLGAGVSRLLVLGALAQVGEDDSGFYYRTTEDGKELLLVRQSERRKQNGFAHSIEEQQSAKIRAAKQDYAPEENSDA